MFVPDLARIAAPLNRQLEKNEPTRIAHLTDDEFQSLDRLKQALVNAPILDLPKNKVEYRLDTDSCECQLE